MKFIQIRLSSCEADHVCFTSEPYESYSEGRSCLYTAITRASLEVLLENPVIPIKPLLFPSRSRLTQHSSWHLHTRNARRNDERRWKPNSSRHLLHMCHLLALLWSTTPNTSVRKMFPVSPWLIQVLPSQTVLVVWRGVSSAALHKTTEAVCVRACVHVRAFTTVIQPGLF